MSKIYEIEIDQIMKFNHKVKVKVDDNIDIEKVLDELEEKGNHSDDIYYYLNGDNGVELLKFVEDGSGESSFEVPEYNEVEE